MSTKRKDIGLYCVVDFIEGPQCIPSNWLDEDHTLAYWPPWAQTIDQVRFDKNVKRRLKPEADWTQEVVLKIRSHGDDFERVRGKLKEAAVNSDTNLDTSCDEAGNRRLPKRKSKLPQRLCDSEDDAEGEPETSIPSPPKKANTQSKSRQRTSTTASSAETLTSYSKAVLPAFPTPSLRKEPSSPARPTKSPTPRQRDTEQRQDSITARSPFPESQPAGATGVFPTLRGSPRRSPRKSPRRRSLFDSLEEDPVVNAIPPRSAPASRTPNLSDEDFKKLVLVNLKSLRTQQISMANDIAKLLSKRPTAPVTDGDEEVNVFADAALVGLPAVELEEFIEFDSKLKQDANYKAKVGSALKQVGGTTLGGAVRGMLTRVMTDNIAELYSFQGGKGKKRFDELAFKRVLFSSVRGNEKYRGAKDIEIREAICKWLANAKTRLSKKKTSTRPIDNGRLSDNSDVDE